MPDKSRRYLLTPLAEHDLEDIWLYTYEIWSRDQADHYNSTIMGAIEALASGKVTGRDAREIREGYAKYHVGRHVVFFQESETQMIVVRILHQAMDIPAHIGGEAS